MKVNVYINRSDARFLGRPYEPGDLLTLALSFEAEAESALALCDRTFAALNTPTPTPVGTLDSAQIAGYHQVYPSLSIGDMVEVEGKRYTCQTIGWLSLDDRVPTKPLGRSQPKFPMGQFVATSGVVSLEIDLLPLLARHASGDWGDLCAEDKATNEQALLHGERLMSSYETPAGSVWVITEADRSATTVLLASEY